MTTPRSRSSDNGDVVCRHRVIFGDTDAMGIVYYGNYMRYLEIGRGEYFRSVGGAYRAVEEAGYALPVSEVRLKYRAPARYDDEIEIHTRLERVGRVRLRFLYRIERISDGCLLADGFTIHGCTVSKTGRPTRLPDIVLEALGLD